MEKPTPSRSTRGRPAALANVGRFAGAIGAMLLLSAPFTWLLTEVLGVFFLGKLCAGGLLVGFYLFTNADFFARLSGSRSAGLLAISVASATIVIGVVGVVNFVVLINDQEADLTREGIHSLSDQTSNVLARLEIDVRALAFYHPDEREAAGTKQMLERYAGESDRFSFEMVDPDSQVTLQNQYSITDRGPRIVVLAGEREARAKDASEIELTNAIIRVAQQTTKAIYFLTGHGEPVIDDPNTSESYQRVATAIRDEGYQVASLSLLRATKGASKGKIDLRAAITDAKHPDDSAEGVEVPVAVSVLVVGGARSMLFVPELAAIDAYLHRGGRVIVLVDPKVDTGIKGLLAKWKIEVRDDVVIDPRFVLGFGPAAPTIYATGEHPISAGLITTPVFSTARSLGVIEEGALGIEARSFLSTDEGAWGETDETTAERSEEDNLGPVNLAMVATKHIPSHEAARLTDEARLVVFGDSDWLSNEYIAKMGNADLFANTVHWMATEEERISVGRKLRRASRVVFTASQLGVLKLVSLDILPILYLAFGLGIVLVRRQR